jgi:hypothetical protein
MPVESRTLAGKSGALSCHTDILAREPATDNVGFTFMKFSRCDIVMAWNIRPMLGENFTAKWLDFAERDDPHSGSFKT